jgi:hypothetical protein
MAIKKPPGLAPEGSRILIPSPSRRGAVLRPKAYERYYYVDEEKPCYGGAFRAETLAIAHYEVNIQRTLIDDQAGSRPFRLARNAP